MPVRILFVCYENICRSPMAEGVFRHLSAECGFADGFEVMSAGTVCHQAGSSPDTRAVSAAARFGIDISGIRAQCIHDLDLGSFDRVFVMDQENYFDVIEAMDGFAGNVVRMVTEFHDEYAGTEIEDPYYGPEEGFDRTLVKLAGCIGGILRQLPEECGILDAGPFEPESREIL